METVRLGVHSDPAPQVRPALGKGTTFRCTRNNGKVKKEMRTFGTKTRELMELRNWLHSESCTHLPRTSRPLCYHQLSPPLWWKGTQLAATEDS